MALKNIWILRWPSQKIIFGASLKICFVYEKRVAMVCDSLYLIKMINIMIRCLVKTESTDRKNSLVEIYLQHDQPMEFLYMKHLEE